MSDLHADDAGRVRPAYDPAADWPLVGRADELGRAAEALRQRRGIAIVGEAGTGKTRLATAVVESSSIEGVRWYTVVGSQGAARVPLGAWSHLLPDSWEPGADDLATWRFLAGGLEASHGSIHLFVDDAQWLDSVSAGLVHHLVTTGRAKVLITVRRGEPASQPIMALWKDGHLDRLDLESLAARDTTALLEGALGAPVEPRTSARLHQRSRGNLLMLRELVDAALADGDLQLWHGAWVQTGSTRTSPRLVDLLADRIEGLTPDERAGAELVALVEPIAGEIVEQALTPELLSRLVARRLVEIDRSRTPPVVRSSHPLLAEVLVDRTDEERRREVVRLVVDLVEATPTVTDADLVRIAVWRLELGLPLDGGYALRAADLALARYDFGLAEELAGVALEAGLGAAATVRLGEALAAQQRLEEAEEVLAPVAGQLGDLEPRMRLRYAEGRIEALSTGLGRIDDAIAVLEEALTTMPEGGPRWTLEGRLAFMLSDRGRLRAAAPLADARMEGIVDDEVSALAALTAFTMVRTVAGRGREALDACDALVPVAMAHADDMPDALGWIAAQRMLALYFLGEIAELDSFSAMVDAMVADDPDPTRRAAVLMVRGLVAADQGRLNDSVRLLQQTAALHELDNRRGYQSWTFAIMSRAKAQLGQLDEAERDLDHARQMLWPGGQVFSSDLDAAAVWIAASQGRLGEAEELLADAVRRTDAEDMVMASGYLRHEAIRAGLAASPHVDALATLAAVEQGHRSAIWHAHAVALVEDDGAGLVEVGHRFAALGTHLASAEAFARGAGAHRRAGSPALAAQAKELSRQQLVLCPGASTPALHTGDLVVALTGRELDIATRAASGQANLEIAEALGISVRTVETHLQRAFSKLGVKRRTELAPLLRPAGRDGAAPRT